MEKGFNLIFPSGKRGERALVLNKVITLSVISALLILSFNFVYAVTYQSEPTETSVKIQGEVQYICIEGEWHDENGETFEADCNVPGVNEEGESIGSCCPSGFSCNEDSGECEPEISEQISCSSFTTRQTCEAATAEQIKDSVYEEVSGAIADSIENIKESDFCVSDNVYETTLEGDEYLISGPCKCVWEAEVNDDESNCKSTFPYTLIDENEGNQIFSCERTSTLIDRCEEDGFRILNISVNIVDENGNIVDRDSIDASPSFCKSEERTYSCPQDRESQSLPFFSFWNLISALIIIVIVYFLTGKKFKILDS